MGLDINAVRLPIDARKRGADFGTLPAPGRRDWNVDPAKMAKTPEAHGAPAAAFRGADKALWSEPCFRSLDAKEAHSMGFKGAALVHVLNKPVGAVFNVCRNALNLLRIHSPWNRKSFRPVARP